MAEIAVNFIINKLGDLLVQEIKLLKGVRKQVQGIRGDLQSIRAYLKDAEARAATEEGESNEGIKTWVTQLREEAYHIEDVIDQFSLTVAQLPRGYGLVGILHKISRFIKKIKLQHGIATEIEDIKSTLAEIHQRGQFYNFRSIEQGSSSGTRDVIPHDSRVGSFFTEDTEVVGIESTRDELIDLLVNGKSDRSVIAVVGEGGLGKTTLTGKIFNNDAIKKHFDCQAWITVGKEYIKNDILTTIIQELYRVTGSAPGETDKMKEKDFIATLREYLKDKCYMVVFDDVWSTEFWKDVEPALIDNTKSSRVMLTTRNKAVAYAIPFVNTHMLEPLPLDRAWELFCIKAFGSKLSCPPELEKLSHDILVKCGGLPLAIAAIGGLLSNKNKVASEWQKLLDSLGSKLGSDPHLKSCNRVLSEGYYDLPYHLKSCLLYFGLFPESYSITCGRLIRLWIAEGFVQYSKHLSCEQVAEECLTELIDRSLVQVSGRKFSGRARSCKVHDLMYEVIIKKTQELGFSQVLNGEDLTQCSKSRRVSINKSLEGVLGSSKDLKIRSVFLFNIDKWPESFMTEIIVDFKLIKVLDFEDSPMDYLPDGVGNLFHLHYLSLRNTRVKKLPKSIGRLINLETLDLKWSSVTELPIEIKNMKKLRYLMVLRLDSGDPYGGRTKVQEGFGALTSLRKLSFVHAHSEVIEELRKLRQLRVLGIRLENKDVKDLFSIIKNFEDLEFLGVEPINKEEILDVQSVASPSQSLQHFYLSGNIMKLPNWISELHSLIKVELSLLRSTDDLMRILQALPNLLQLVLIVTHCDEQLHIKEGWFPKLKRLRLRDFEELKLLTIDKGALPNLKEMEIGPCPLLEEIPAGIEHLRNLKFLIFIDMVKKIYWMMKTENWERITKHIPKVGVIYEETEREYFYYTTKYLSSLSPGEFAELIGEQDESNLTDNASSDDSVLLQGFVTTSA